MSGHGSSAAPAALTSGDATTLAKRLDSADPQVVAGALAEQVRGSYLARPRPIVPAGDTLAIDASTFTPGVGGPGYGTAHAVATGPQPGQFLVFLAYEGNGWRVVATVQQ